MTCDRMEELNCRERWPTQPETWCKGCRDGLVGTLPLTMTLHIDFSREDDGRWLAEVVGLPGVMAYGTTLDEARTHAWVLALRVIADRLEQL